MRTRPSALIIAVLLVGGTAGLTPTAGATADGPPSYTSHDCGCEEFGLELDWGGFEGRTDPMTLECHCRATREDAVSVDIVVQYYANPTQADASFVDARTVFEDDVARLTEDEPNELLAVNEEADRFGYLLTGSDITGQEGFWANTTLARSENYVATSSLYGPVGLLDVERAQALFEQLEAHSIAIIDGQSQRFFIFPGVLAEVPSGDTLSFSVLTASGERVDTEREPEFTWRLGNCESISDYYQGAAEPAEKRIVIAEIDEETGVLIGRNIGSCELVMYHEGSKADRVPVHVVCPSDPPGDLEQVLRAYVDQIPSGPILEDVTTGRASAGLGELTPGHANNIVYSLHASSEWLESWSEDGNSSREAWAERYGPYTCGGYQQQVYVWLSRMQARGNTCGLLNGYRFLPIRGEKGGHHAVVVFPDGEAWTEVGVVLDPWPTQTPRHYPIAYWHRAYYPAEEEAFAVDRVLYTSDGSRVSGSVRCPVELLVTDDLGRRAGLLPDGSTVLEIPDAIVVGALDDDGGYTWWYDLNAGLSSTYGLQLRGTASASFTLVTLDGESGRLRSFEDVRIETGEMAELDVGRGPVAPLVLPNGDELASVGSELTPDAFTAARTPWVPIVVVGSALAVGLMISVVVWRRRRAT